MAVNEVLLNGEPVMSTIGDTVSPETLVEGYTATDSTGAKITGEFKPVKTVNGLGPDANGNVDVSVIEGPAGADGVGIESMWQSVTGNGSKAPNEWRIKLTDGTSEVFTVYNGDTGEQGPAGADGVGIAGFEYSQSLADDGYNTLTINLTDGDERVFQIKNGSKGSTGDTGKEGVGIEDIVQVSKGEGSKAENTMFIYLTDNTHKSFTVLNGDTGEQGPAGTDGEDGKSAYEYAKEQGFEGNSDDFGRMLVGEQPPYIISIDVEDDGITGTMTNLSEDVLKAKNKGQPFKVHFSDPNYPGAVYYNPSVDIAGRVYGEGIVYVDEEKVVYRKFEFVPSDSDPIPSREMTDTVILTKGGNAPVFVNVNKYMPDVYTADMTRAEISEAYNNGKSIYCVCGLDILPLSEWFDPTNICFSGAVDDEIITVRIGIDNETQEDKVTVTKNTITTETTTVTAESKLFPISIKSGTDGYYADKTFDEIHTAYNAGYDIYCNLTYMESQGIFTYYQRVPLESRVDASSTGNAAYFYFSSFSPSSLSIAGARGVFIRIASDEKVTVSIGSEGIKSPGYLKLTGAVDAIYDGSKSVTVEIPEGGSGSSQRGTGILIVTDSPEAYTTTINGVTPAYRILLDTVKTQSKNDEVLVGDIILCSSVLYPVVNLDAMYVYCGEGTSIKGDTGEKGETGSKGDPGNSEGSAFWFNLEKNGDDYIPDITFDEMLEAYNSNLILMCRMHYTSTEIFILPLTQTMPGGTFSFEAICGGIHVSILIVKGLDAATVNMTSIS